MRINLSTRELTAFVNLAEERNFTRAAALSHLSQPAFSTLIRSLETSIGARLFDRTTRNVELTAEGRLLIEPARRLLADVEAALTDVDDHVARRRGRVSVAALPSLAAGWLPPLIAEFHRKYPGVEIHVADVLSDACIERVRDGRADFALASSRSEHPELHTESYCTDTFHVVCRKEHPLAAHKIVELADLAGHPVVQMSRSSSVRQCVDAATYPNRMLSILELDQLSTVAGMVRAGLGVSILPSLTLFYFDHPELTSRPLRAPGLARQVFLIRRADRGLSNVARALYQLVTANRPNPAVTQGTRARRGAKARTRKRTSVQAG
jgi:DNA-binding transcriptional LysR family regulator